MFAALPLEAWVVESLAVSAVLTYGLVEGAVAAFSLLMGEYQVEVDCRNDE